MLCRLFLIPLVLVSTTFAAEAEKGKAVEIAVSKIYVPENGYDDNDRIEMVVEGELPNACYTLTQTVIDKTQEKGTFHIRQMAWRRLSGPCRSGNELDPIPFAQPVSLGNLGAGPYKIVYKGDSGASEQGFTVEEAKSGHVDNYFYAIVTQINSEDFYREGSPIKISLRGLIPSTCLELDSTVKAEVQKDVLLISPAIRRNDHHSRATGRKLPDSRANEGRQRPLPPHNRSEKALTG